MSDSNEQSNNGCPIMAKVYVNGQFVRTFIREGIDWDQSELKDHIMDMIGVTHENIEVTGGEIMPMMSLIDDKTAKVNMKVFEIYITMDMPTFGKPEEQEPNVKESEEDWDETFAGNISKAFDKL